MKISKIHIEKFLGIKHLESTFNGKLQLIAGPNNACKSTVLKAINLFFTGNDRHEKSDYTPQNKYYESDHTRPTTKIRIHFKELTDREKTTFKNLWLPKKKEIWIELRIDKHGRAGYHTSNSGNGKSAFESLSNIYDIMYIPAVRAGTNSRENENRKLFIAAKDALARQRKGELNELQKQFKLRAKGVSKVISEILTESTKTISNDLPGEAEIGYDIPEHDEILDLILSKTKIKTRKREDLTIEDEGTGFQSLLSLGLLRHVSSRNRSRNLLLLVEEPEAFLHPQHQRSVSEYLKELSLKNQVIVTTHSSILIDSVKIDNILRLPKKQDGLTYKWEWDSNNIQDIEKLSRFCNTENSEIIFADKVILCEGISDFYIINQVKKKILKGDQYKRNISTMGGDGSSIVHVAQLMDIFEIPYLTILDKDCYTEDRTTLKNICKNKNKQITSEEHTSLDKLKAIDCQTSDNAADCRRRANQLLRDREIYCLGGDIETAVLHSYTKQKLLEAIRPENLALIDKAVLSELSQLKASDYRKRINCIMGAKGWNNDIPKSARNKKVKPHNLKAIAETNEGAETNNSDLRALREAITVFIEKG